MVGVSGCSAETSIRYFHAVQWRFAARSFGNAGSHCAAISDDLGEARRPPWLDKPRIVTGRIEAPVMLQQPKWRLRPSTTDIALC
jgi:hypothetical protein